MASAVMCSKVRTKVGINLPTFFIYASITTLIFQVNYCQANQGVDAESIIVKLDEILEVVANLSSKCDHLEKVIQRQKNCKHDTGDFKQNYPAPQRLEASNLRDKDNPSTYEKAEDISASNLVESNKETHKRESKDGQVSTKDLFHFNRLAPNSNIIPSSSIPWTSKDEGDLNEWLLSPPGQYLQHEQRQMMSSISQQYETMFGNALDNLNNVLKEQLTGFRITLNKLMNRLMDHSYQYNIVANQLSLVKDECSLAASCSQNDRELLGSNKRGDKTTTASSTMMTAEEESKPTSAASQIGSQMRTSDISMMVRLISNELSDMLHRTRPQSRCFDNDQLDQSTLFETAKILNETRFYMTRKLNEIDSVVKQSALFLTKLNTKLPQLISIEKPIGQNQTITITYNNSATNSELKALESVVTLDTSSTTVVEAQANDISRPPKSTRWFPGSKLPAGSRNRANEVIIGEIESHHRYNEQQSTTRQKCRSKTNLTLPSSCEQLRKFGANCTGQYYVFVRSEIKHVYCDMNNDNEEGWTVILRRLDKSLKDPLLSDSLTNSSMRDSLSAINNNNTAISGIISKGSNHLLEVLKASQLNFNLDWLKYKNGFGQLNEWAEFFVGLDLLHQLTNDPSNQTTTELQIDLETIKSNKLHLRFDKFHISNEESQYKVTIGACNESLACQPMIAINGSKFYTFERFILNETKTTTDTTSSSTSPFRRGAKCDNEGLNYGENNIQPQPLYGWWFPDWFLNLDTNAAACKAKDFVSLTKPLGKQQQQQQQQRLGEQINLSEGQSNVDHHIYWPNWEHSSEPLKRIVMKVHRKRLASISLSM